MISRPAEKTELDDEVRTIPRHLFFFTELMASSKSVSNSRFKLFTGGRFIVTVAIPDCGLISTSTSLPALEQHRTRDLLACKEALPARITEENMTVAERNFIVDVNHKSGDWGAQSPMGRELRSTVRHWHWGDYDLEYVKQQ